MVEEAARAEASGTPLILDADAIALFRDYTACAAIKGRRDSTAPEPGVPGLPVFHGNALLTPHAGELENLSGIAKADLLSQPERIAELARTMNAAILFKSHVMILASPDGELTFIDGMEPSVGAGGSGDVLAGLCAGIAARMRAAENRGGGMCDLCRAATAAGTLLIAASRSAGRRFYDPLELAEHAALLAGEAWLPAAGLSAGGFPASGFPANGFSAGEQVRT
jgi:NAD(P)H-hydrate epimerase